MSVKVFVPTALRSFTNGEDTFQTHASSVKEVLFSLIEVHQALKQHLFSEDQTLRSFVNVYVNDEDMRSLDGLDTSLKDGDEIMIVPSIAGGKK